jgi:hypothetical protein
VFEIKEIIRASIIGMVVLNTLVMGWNFGLVATESEYVDFSGNTINQSPEPLWRGNGNINWSQIEVLSEPVLGQNFNTLGSKRPDIAVENGKIYVVWSDGNDTNGAGMDPDIFFRYFDEFQNLCLVKILIIVALISL